MAASLLSSETLHVLNVGVSGVLVESAVPLPVNAEFRMQLVLESYVSDVTVKVRRVLTVPHEEHGTRYRLGLEVLDLSPEAEDAIDQLVAMAQAQA
jgi:hypothetical protein